ncbi:MarR family winged helix-turn-helix transcriptional regulator [Brucella pituitosa]|uniref:MarR family winged helix-turn-helix transcriptional regulator n=1 Tax=Brucella pituitosa TaxID=571256 RepID=UPI0009A1FB27|nr:MarR family transcriptional regulator [Brucella pituitosa]
MHESELDWQSLSRVDGPQNSPGFVMWRLFMQWQRGLNARLKPLDLTQPKFAVLSTISWLSRDGAAISQQTLAQFLQLDRMHVSQLVSRLDQDGLLDRRPSPKDQREKLLSASPLGLEKIRQAIPVVESFDADFFQRHEADFLRSFSKGFNSRHLNT